MSNKKEIPKPLHEGYEKKGGINSPPKNPRPPITPSGQNPPQIKQK